MKRALILLLILSLSHSSLLWDYTTDGQISAKPVIYSGAVVVASDDGNIYALDLNTGARKWQAAVGKTPNEIIPYDNSLLISTTKGKVVKIGPNGALIWESDLASSHNATYIYGVSANQKEIFVAANNGVYLLEKNGSVRSKLATFNDSVLTPPAAGADYVIFGNGDLLLRISDSGIVQWKTPLPSASSFWSSRPVIEGSVVYIGALDNSLHAFILSNGLETWNAKTRNWVLSTPLYKDGIVYFGSDDGNVYAINSGDGSQLWAAHTQLSVQTQPETGTMGGQEVVFAGSGDRSIYAISRESGEIVWKGSAEGGVGSPLFYSNKVIFGSGDRKVYAYSTERACSITSPLDAQVLGPKEVVVRGKYVSESGEAKVLIQINENEWLESNTSAMDWVYYIDPKSSFISGLNSISCQVADSGGTETGTKFTSVTVNYDPLIPPSDLVVTVSPNIVEGKDFTIYVNDADDGSPADRFNLTIEGGKTYSGDKNYTLNMPAAGTYKATVKKIGFNDATVNITVNPSGVNPLYIAIAALLILLIIWQLWTRFLAQRFAKKR